MFVLADNNFLCVSSPYWIPNPNSSTLTTLGWQWMSLYCILHFLLFPYCLHERKPSSRLYKHSRDAICDLSLCGIWSDFRNEWKWNEINPKLQEDQVWVLFAKMQQFIKRGILKHLTILSTLIHIRTKESTFSQITSLMNFYIFCANSILSDMICSIVTHGNSAFIRFWSTETAIDTQACAYAKVRNIP